MVHHCLSGSKWNFSVWNSMWLVFWPLNSFLVLSPTIFFEKNWTPAMLHFFPPSVFPALCICCSLLLKCPPPHASTVVPFAAASHSSLPILSRGWHFLAYPGDGIFQHGLVPRTNGSPRAAGCALPRGGHSWTLTWTSNIYLHEGKRVCGRGRRMATKSLTAKPLLISDTEIISGQRVWR